MPIDIHDACAMPASIVQTQQQSRERRKIPTSHFQNHNTKTDPFFFLKERKRERAVWFALPETWTRRQTFLKSLMPDTERSLSFSSFYSYNLKVLFFSLLYGWKIWFFFFSFLVSSGWNFWLCCWLSLKLSMIKCFGLMGWPQTQTYVSY